VNVDERKASLEAIWLPFDLGDVPEGNGLPFELKGDQVSNNPNSHVAMPYRMLWCGTQQKSPEASSRLGLAPSRCTSFHNIRYDIYFSGYSKSSDLEL